MRTLSSTLLAAQKSPARRPYVRVEVVNKITGVTRLEWARLYTGSEADSHHAATMPGDSSLVRARAQTGSLYYMRVANPGPGSNFSIWSSLGTISSLGGIALSSRGSEALLFFAGVEDYDTVYYRQSNDYGQSFGSPLSLGAPYATAIVEWLAAAHKPNGDVALFATASNYLYVKTRTSGTWSGWSLWSNSLIAFYGLTVVYSGDWNLIICGRAAVDRRGVWSVIYGDGVSQTVGTWSSLREVAMASGASQTEFRCPSLAFPDVYRLFYGEKYSGSGAYNRPVWCHTPPSTTFVANLWREPVPFDLSSTYGLALAHDASTLFLSAPFGVWRASLSATSQDVSQDVLGLELGDEPGAGGLRLELDNNRGQYNQIGSSGSAIKQGSEIMVSPGYITSAGVEVSTGSVFWVEGWEHVWQGGRSYVVLEAVGPWGLLERWRARNQFAWASTKPVFDLIAFILARAGLKLVSSGGSGPLTSLYPNFTIHPGETGERAVARLLSMVSDVLFFDSSTGYIKEPLSSEASVYGYGQGHPLLATRYISQALSQNWVQVYGQGVVGEAFSWPEVDRVYGRLRQVHDLNLDTVAEAQARGQAELGRLARAAVRDEVLVPTNCGQQLYDVVDITDPNRGLSEAKRRVLGLRLAYSPREAKYEHRLHLGGA